MIKSRGDKLSSANIYDYMLWGVCHAGTRTKSFLTYIVINFMVAAAVRLKTKFHSSLIIILLVWNDFIRSRGAHERKIFHLITIQQRDDWLSERLNLKSFSIHSPPPSPSVIIIRAVIRRRNYVVKLTLEVNNNRRHRIDYEKKASHMSEEGGKKVHKFNSISFRMNMKGKISKTTCNSVE